MTRDSSCLFDDDSWNVNICSYWNDACCGYPPLTTREMPIAYVKLSEGDGEILSSCIDYIYNKSNQQNTTGLLTDYHYDSATNCFSVTVGGTTKTATATGLLTDFCYCDKCGYYSVKVGGTTKNATTKDLFSGFSITSGKLSVTIGGTNKTVTPKIIPSFFCGGYQCVFIILYAAGTCASGIGTTVTSYYYKEGFYDGKYISGIPSGKCICCYQTTVPEGCTGTPQKCDKYDLYAYSFSFSS